MNNEHMTQEELEQIAAIVAEKVIICTKEMLTLEEMSHYMGVSTSQLYRLTMNREIPHYKPTGKMCYFNREEVEAWLQNNRVSTREEIRGKAQLYCMTHDLTSKQGRRK